MEGVGVGDILPVLAVAAIAFAVIGPMILRFFGLSP
jgi:hypothetical protein